MFCLMNQLHVHSRRTGRWFSGVSYHKFRNFNSNSWVGDETDDHDEKPITPWVRSVASGVDLLRNPKYNKGMAFTEEERDRHYLHGLLPPAFNSQEMQVQRVLSNLREYSSDLQRYIHLMALQERNERLFYRVMIEHIEEILPIVYTPTVGQVCQKYGLMFRRPRGLFISSLDRGRVMAVLKNWPERRVRALVLTDGERVLGLGDLGVQGMGIPVAKLAVQVACGGIHPAECLPVTLDVGTDNQQLLRDPMYPGLRQRRLTGEAYDELVDEFMEAAKERYGSDVLIQFEDFASHNSFRLLFQYRGSHLVFNDDIQGTAAVALAGVLAALRAAGVGGALGSHTVLFSGAGEAAAGVAELLATAVQRQRQCSPEEARLRIWLLDAHGLVLRPRAPSLPPHTLPFAHATPPAWLAQGQGQGQGQCGLLQAVKLLKPSILLCVSGGSGAPPPPLSEEVCRAMAELNPRPVLLSFCPPHVPTCTAQQAHAWTQGRCLFAGPSGSSPQLHAEQANEEPLYRPPEGKTAYIFPGVALGCHLAGSTRMRDEMLLAAAEALASQVSEEDLQAGHLYPPFWKIRSLSAHVARAVAAKAYDFGLATRLPRPPNLLECAHQYMYNPQYRPLR